MLTTMKCIRRSLALGLALAAVTTTPAWAGPGANEFAQYDASGRGPQGPVEGTVLFGIDNSGFQASFTAQDTALGTNYTAVGDYDQLSLGVIDFWSFEGTDMQLGGTATATGHGIRLLFGLLVFGTIKSSGGGAFHFSGVFEALLIQASAQDAAHAASSPAAEECVALLRRRTLALERL
jgi:hypothetical protein